jgi:hypothetical protein
MSLAVRLSFLAVLATGCAQAHTGLDQTPTANEKVPSQLIRSLNVGVPRDVLVELVPANSEQPNADAGQAAPRDAGQAAPRDAGQAAPPDAGQDAGQLVNEDAGTDSGVGVIPEALVRDRGDLPTETASSLIDEDLEERASYYAATQTALLDAIKDQDVSVITQYEHVPFVFVNVTSLRGLYALANRPEVLRLHEDTSYAHQLTESLPLINQPAVAMSGKTGANTAVAVLDTGVDFTRSDFGGCESAGADGCKVAFAQDFAANDSALDDNGHGTNVAAIVLGVAPSTKVLALDVFETSGLAMSSGILAAVDWSIKNRTTYNIVAMNLSLGGGKFNVQCTKDVFATALANARAAGIVPVVAAGNSGYTGALASPACTPAAVSVGAVYDANIGPLSFAAASCSDTSTEANKVACFSNSASFLSLLAPGAAITAGGFRMLGTSQAAPHVAGSLAVIRSAFAGEAVNASIARMTDSGFFVRDARNGVTKRRLDLQAAMKGVTTARDNTPPSGSVVINNKQANTTSRDVSLTITGSDASGVDSMCISNAGTCTTFEPFSTTRAWQLTQGDGTKTVRVAIKDAAGNQAVFTASIRLDTTAPSGAALRSLPQDGAITLSWSAATDAGSGVGGYRLVVAQGTPPSSCREGSLIYNGNALTFKHTGLTNGTAYGYRLCAADSAGNVAVGSTLSARPAPETTPPTGTVKINNGTTLTGADSVTLNLVASDLSGVTQMCVSNSRTTCTTWEAYSQSKVWTLATKSGATNVYVWFEDVFGNRSTMPVSASITVDSTPPTGVSLTVTGATKSINLTWPAASDPSGTDKYTLVYLAGETAPASCAAGTKLYEGALRAFTHKCLAAEQTCAANELTIGATYSYRLCATDKAGNQSPGVTRSTQARN